MHLTSVAMQGTLLLFELEALCRCRDNGTSNSFRSSSHIRVFHSRCPPHCIAAHVAVHTHIPWAGRAGHTNSLHVLLLASNEVCKGNGLGRASYGHPRSYGGGLGRVPSGPPRSYSCAHSTHSSGYTAFRLFRGSFRDPPSFTRTTVSSPTGGTYPFLIPSFPEPCVNRSRPDLLLGARSLMSLRDNGTVIFGCDLHGVN